MPLPKPKKDEQENQYMARCMAFLADEDKPNEQKVAMCITTFRSNGDEAQAELINKMDIAYCSIKYLEEIELGSEEELTVANFYIPADDEYEDFGETTEEVSAASLWENIRKKKERMGKKYKPAKPGDKDRPDPEAWKKAQSKFKYKNMKTGEVHMYDRRGDYTKDGQKLFYLGEASIEEASEELLESMAAEYQGRKVTLNKPFRTPSGPKKFAVYTNNESGNVVIVRFGDPNMKIKKNVPERRKSFRARHNCDSPGPKWKARYWACKSW